MVAQEFLVLSVGVRVPAGLPLIRNGVLAPSFNFATMDLAERQRD